MSNLTVEKLLSIKRLTKNLIKITGGFACQEVRVGQTALHNYTDPDKETYFIPVDVVADLELEAGKPIVTEFLAGLLNYRLVPISAGPDSGKLGTMTARLGKEAAEYFSNISEALEDGTVSREEAQSALSELADVAQAVDSLIMALKQIADKVELTFTDIHGKEKKV